MLYGRVQDVRPDAARQTGSALGVAVLGIFISQDQSALLMSGMHLAFIIASIAFFAGWIIALRWVEK